MKQIGEAFDPYSAIEYNKKNNSDSEDYIFQTEALVNEVYISLCAIFKNCWISNNQSDINAYKKQLYLGFRQFSVETQEQIEFGLHKARATDLDVFPSVKMVINWCLDKKEIRPQHDTRDKEYFDKFALESDEHKEKRKKLAKDNLSRIKSLLT